jgi:hypothetical protein
MHIMQFGIKYIQDFKEYFYPDSQTRYSFEEAVAKLETIKKSYPHNVNIIEPIP